MLPLLLAPEAALAQDSVSALRQEIRQAQAHLQALTARLDALERGQGNAPPPAPSAVPPASRP